MFRKKYSLIILTISLILAGGLTALGQTTGPISGKVILTKDDGTTQPVEGALVEVFRIDQRSGSLSDKTDKSGSFAFAGVALGGTYVLSVSGPGLEPALSPNLRAGAKYDIQVRAGDGRQLTEDEVRTALENEKVKMGEMSAEDKKKMEEEEKKIAEIKAKNEKAIAANEAVSKALEEGVKAFNDGKKAAEQKNFDLAISNYDIAFAKFDEGVNANPEFIGSAPGLLNNKAASLNERAVATYNKMVTSKDPALKTELVPKVQQDFEGAITAYARSWELSKKAKPEEITNQKSYEDNKATALRGAQDTVRLMVRTGAASETKKEEVKMLMQEYVAFEVDKEKKIAGQLNFANYFNKIFDFENAVVQWRKAVELAPTNADAVGGLGLALYTVTYGQDDTARKQESLNYLQYYLDSSPKDHPLRQGIDDAVKDLMSQKLKPQKISAKN